MLPLYIIFKEKIYIENWYKDIELPRDSRIKVSPNRWTINKIGLCWLKNIFISLASSCITGKYYLLILDSHGSHLLL